MEASVRIINSLNFNRHLSSSILTKHSLNFPPIHPLTHTTNHTNLLFHNLHPSSRFRCVFQSSSSSSPISNPFSSSLPKSLSHLFNLNPRDARNNGLDKLGFDSNSKEKFFNWNRASPVNNNGGELGILRDDKGPVYTVVMLGWLGAEQKHLKRYIELYTAKGIHAISFVIPVKDLLGFDLGKRVEKRIEELTEELISWLSKTEDDGRERGLLFHTFSNTGWLSYGAILNDLQSRGEFTDKIRGCVIDSGGDPEIDPQVWAAGFSAAILKKRSSTTEETEPFLAESLILSSFNKFFSFILQFPDINRRITKVTTTLMSNQPDCPQLYLYSTSDKVIPFGRVEMFIQTQRMLGLRRKVWAYNFGSSPHVDHYRSFPHVYCTELHRFLKECVATVGH